MPRKSRIDAPGALHHIIARGIARGKIFKDDQDRRSFLDRLGAILVGAQTTCYAWVLIPNHFHLLLRTGAVPVATVMRRLLTGYAIYYNRRHRRYGHLFQNRYKSILCQEDPYFLELVRYIHLNALRAKLVENLGQLDKYRYSGHSVLMGKGQEDWQDTDYVLRLFGERLISARRNYRNFVKKGIAEGKRNDLIGGGVVRSVGGWANIKALRKAKVYVKGDERILGDGDFIDQVLSAAEEALENKYMLQARGIDLDTVAERVAELLDMEVAKVWSEGKYHKVVKARSLLCYWAVRKLGVGMSNLGRRLKITPAAVSQSVLRGEKLAKDQGYEFVNKLQK